jgi:hypothetical protein
MHASNEGSRELHCAGDSGASDSMKVIFVRDEGQADGAHDNGVSDGFPNLKLKDFKATVEAQRLMQQLFASSSGRNPLVDDSRPWENELVQDESLGIVP